MGILLKKVCKNSDRLSVVANINLTLAFLITPFSPILENVPVSINVNNFSWPSLFNLCTSSKNKTPPSDCSIRPALDSFAPVYAPFTCPNNRLDNNSKLL